MVRFTEAGGIPLTFDQKKIALMRILPEEVRRSEVLEAIDEMLVTQHEAQYVGPSDDFNEDEPDTRKIKLFNNIAI